MSTGKGYGKLILFGEHFVVYGLPGIASGLNDIFIESTAEKINEDKVIIEDNKFFKGEIVDVYKDIDENKSKYYKPIFEYKNSRGVKITWDGNIGYSGGMGFSAAAAVSIIRAMDLLENWNLNDEEVNSLAYECEKIANGNPSGIDNTCATYGSLVWFEKQQPRNIVQPFKSEKELFFVIADTNVWHETDKVVASVRERKDADPEKFEEIFKDANELVIEAKQALEHGDIKMIGELMNNNQTLLREIGVSCDELEELIEIALEKGALGAKLSGAGAGGIMIALAENIIMQEKIAKAFEEKGYKTMKTSIGG
ncbi:MAG: mevalonate kinase [Candidatus Diapherotrites archaeon]|jgi:mevalonate kinase|nr:mevalonate kinase [Candidatus Diapherotrites archaeon]MBT4597278.1 mevalonate kinase [Candidatus Diapherotrites archaeon]